MVISHLWLDARPSNFDGRHSITPRFYTRKVTAQVRNKTFTLYNLLNSHLGHKRTWQPFSQRRDAHDDTKNMWDISSRFWDKLTEKLKLVPSFSHSSLLLAWRSCTFMKIEYAVALFPMVGYRMAQEWRQYHLRFRTYAGRKNSLLLLLLLLILSMTSASKKILRIKKGT